MSEYPPENALRPEVGPQQQTVLDFAVSQSAAVFYIADLAGERPIRFISDNVKTITGHDAAAFLAESRFGRALIHPDDLPAYERGLDGLAERGQVTVEYRFRCGGGQYRWFRDEQRVVAGDGGQAQQFVGCMIDITERVEAAEESDRISNILQQAIESIPNGFALYDAEDRLVLCNSAFADAFGKSPAEVIGLSRVETTRLFLRLAKIYDGKRVGDPEAMMAHALARTAEAQLDAIECQMEDGNWLQITSHPTVDGRRVIMRTDITRLKQAEISLSESEVQFRSIVEANPLPVRVADIETWQVIYESPAAAALFGRPWPAREKRSTVDTYADDEARLAVVEALYRERRIDNKEVLMRREDGNTFWASLSSKVVRFHGKDVCVTSLVDLTESKIREAELRQARETLEDAIEALSEGLALYDPEDRLVMCNSQYRTFHHGSEDLLVPGAHWPDVTRARAERGLFKEAEGDIDGWLAGQMAERGVASNREFPFGDRWFEYSHRPTRQGGFVSTWRDVTERRQMEEDLRESEAMVRQVLEASPVPLRMWRPRTSEVLYESPAAAAMFGRRGQDMTPEENRLRYVDPQDHVTYMGRLHLGGAVDDMEVHLRRYDGSTFWGSVSARLIDYRGEEVVVSSIVDLTERKAMEQVLRESEALVRQVLEASPVPLRMWRPDSSDVLYESPASAALFGRDATKLEPEERRKVYVDPGDHELYLARLRDKGAVDDMEMHMRRRDGSLFWGAVSARLIDYRGEEVVVSSIVDLTERKTMEQALRDSEKHFRMLIEEAPLPVWMIDTETGNLLYESPAAAALTRRSWREGEERNVREFWADPTQRERFVEALSGRGELNNFEIDFRRADGSRITVTTNTRLIRHGDRDAHITVLTDLTEQRQREQELREARETLEDAIESMPEAFSLFDDDDRLVMCNSRFREFNALSAHALQPGTRWIDIIRAGVEKGQYLSAIGQEADWLAKREKYHSLGKVEGQGMEFEQSDGRWFHAFSQSTRQGGYVAIRIDITERKRMELALRESEQLVRQVLEASSVPISMIRLHDSSVIYENPASVALFGEVHTGTPMATSGYWVDPAKREPWLAKLRETGRVDNHEVQLKRRDGSDFWASMSSRLITYQGEDVVVETLFDLTDRRAAEAELSRQREMLHQSEKLSALGELLAGVSHELNNPLSVLVGQALMLSEAATDEQTAARAEKIGKAADRCARIVKTFLAMARQEPRDTMPVDLNEVIEDAIEVMSYSLRTADIEHALELAEALPPVQGDPDQLRQVLINLVVNAQHALEEVDGERKLQIATTYRERDNHVELQVRDTGPGIAPEIRGRIFEPLYTTKEIGTGTGIGLALCHRVVEAHGGSIAVDSRPGEGAVFSIRLPCAEQAAAGQRDKGGRPAEAAAIRILVVDDEEEVGQVISEVLELDGHTVEVAASGQAALEKIKRRRYDVILSDLRMPGMDGPSFYRALSETRPELIESLAFITGDTLSPRVRDFLEGSERPYLEKPIVPRDIRDLVERLRPDGEAGRA